MYVFLSNIVGIIARFNLISLTATLIVLITCVRSGNSLPAESEARVFILFDNNSFTRVCKVVLGQSVSVILGGSGLR